MKIKTKKTVKPKAKVIGKDGNVFNLLGICQRSLRAANQEDKAVELRERVWAAGSYSEALSIMGEYCTLH